MKKVPLVHYKPDGERVVVGVCEVEGDKLSATIHDRNLADKLNRGILEGLSVDLSIAEATDKHKEK